MCTGDDFYTAPYELLRKDNGTAFIVFTCYKTRSPHYEASDEMGEDAPLVAPGSIHMREIFDVKEKDQFKFREYAWSMGNDVNAALEDNAVEVTCKAMGWEVPTNWREVRTKQSIARRAGLAPIWDLVTDSPSRPILVCGHCKQKKERLLTCTGCKSIKYCGSECQRADWRNHKSLCKEKKKKKEEKGAENGIPGMKSCYTLKEGDDISSVVENMFRDITQRPQDHLAAWKKKNAM